VLFCVVLLRGNKCNNKKNDETHTQPSRREKQI
jgi:hypothetical protein